MNGRGELIAKGKLSHDDPTSLKIKAKAGAFQLSSRRTMDVFRLAVVTEARPTLPSKD